MDLLVPVVLPPISCFAPVLTFGLRQLAAALAQASLLAWANLDDVLPAQGIKGAPADAIVTLLRYSYVASRNSHGKRHFGAVAALSFAGLLNSELAKKVLDYMCPQ